MIVPYHSECFAIFDPSTLIRSHRALRLHSPSNRTRRPAPLNQYSRGSDKQAEAAQTF